MRHTDGSLLFKDRIAEENEQARVQKFLDAGAILLGTVNTPEFGHMGKTDNLLVGPTSTPFDLDRNAGDPQEGARRRWLTGLPLCDRRRRGRFDPHSGFVYRNLRAVPCRGQPG
ncbi:amidase family protein [Halalkalicoccus salilacus]|uniref:amidase family protein n=1 Tax=Halalkalicoccus sp. GCM10025704 TaxID=3252662 RepID=UPI00361C8733